MVKFRLLSLCYTKTSQMGLIWLFGSELTTRLSFNCAIITIHKDKGKPSPNTETERTMAETWKRAQIHNYCNLILGSKWHSKIYRWFIGRPVRCAVCVRPLISHANTTFTSAAACSLALWHDTFIRHLRTFSWILQSHRVYNRLL